MANNYRRYMTNATNYTIGIKPGKETVVNVVGTITGGEKTNEITLYNQILVNISADDLAQSSSSKRSIAFVLFFLAAAGGVGYIIIFKRDEYCNFLTRRKEP